jgi:hypothetical protein
MTKWKNCNSGITGNPVNEQVFLRKRLYMIDMPLDIRRGCFREALVPPGKMREVEVAAFMMITVTFWKALYDKQTIVPSIDRSGTKLFLIS